MSKIIKTLEYKQWIKKQNRRKMYVATALSVTGVGGGVGIGYTIFNKNTSTIPIDIYDIKFTNAYLQFKSVDSTIINLYKNNMHTIHIQLVG